MFPEYRDLITELKQKHARFAVLFEKHNQLDHDIASLESKGGYQESITLLKKEKLRIKDEIYKILKKESNS